MTAVLPDRPLVKTPDPVPALAFADDKLSEAFSELLRHSHVDWGTPEWKAYVQPELPTDPRTQRVVELLDELEALGSPDAIADFLIKRGVTAIPGQSLSCAIAVYLREEADAPRVQVRTQSVVIDHNRPLTGPHISMGRNVRAFIGNFDHGAYPELIASGFTHQRPVPLMSLLDEVTTWKIIGTSAEVAS